jgi:hypothetical protein
LEEVKLRTTISRKIKGPGLVKDSEIVEEDPLEVPEILKFGLRVLGFKSLSLSLIRLYLRVKILKWSNSKTIWKLTCKQGRI